jgi:hypothetical protein
MRQRAYACVMRRSICRRSSRRASDASETTDDLKLEPSEASSYAILASALERRLESKSIDDFGRKGALMGYAQAAKLALHVEG